MTHATRAQLIEIAQTNLPKNLAELVCNNVAKPYCDAPTQEEISVLMNALDAIDDHYANEAIANLIKAEIAFNALAEGDIKTKTQTLLKCCTQFNVGYPGFCYLEKRVLKDLISY